MCSCKNYVCMHKHTDKHKYLLSSWVSYAEAVGYPLSQMHVCTPASCIFFTDSSLVLWSPLEVWSILQSRWYLKQPKMQVEVILEPNGMEKHVLEVSKKEQIVITLHW